MSLPCSHDEDLASGHSQSTLVGDDEASVGPKSDRLGSWMVDPPFSVVSCWVSDSESMLVSTNMLVVEDDSIGSHSGDDLESVHLSRSNSARCLDVELLVQCSDTPLLVLAVVATPDDDLVVESVSSS